MAFEEYWFYKFKNELVLLDIDEHKILEKICNCSINDKGNITYIIDDVNNFQKYEIGKFDIVYVSGFTLNELRNAEIAGKNSLVNRGLNQVFKKIGKYKMKQWPQETLPFMDIIMKILNQTLKLNGLFIYQSYASGVASDSPSYVEAIRQQLLSNGITLLNIYRYSNYPSVHLVLGYKGDKNLSRKFLDKTELNPELTNFHGRSDLEHEIVKEIYI